MVVSGLALLPTSPRAADTLGVVAVAEPPGPTPELAEVTAQLRSVVAERTDGVLDADKLRERMSGQTSTATLAELDRAYAGALATYQNGDFEGAVRTLRAVIDDLEKLPDSAEAHLQWTRAMLRLARSEQTLGRKDAGNAILERLVRASPMVKADPNQYPPSFEKQIDDVRAQVRALPQRKLMVQASAKGARVFVDGREVGAAPIGVTLPAGKHRVSGALGALRVPASTVDLVEDGQTVSLNFAMAEALRPGFGPGLALAAAGRPRALVTAGGFLGLDRLLAATFSTEGEVNYLVGTLYDVRRGMLLREGRVRLAAHTPPPGSLTALASFLITGQTSDLVAAVSVQPTPAEPKPPDLKAASLAARPTEGPDLSVRTGAEQPSKALGWTAFGSGIASVGLTAFAVVEGLSANSKYGDAKAMLGPDGALVPGADPAKYNQLVSDGDSAKKAAYIGAAGAVVTAAAAGILGYLAHGEVGPIRF